MDKTEERGTTKACSICKTELPLSEFHRLTKAKDGHQSRCKKCAVRLTTEWQKRWRERTNKKNSAWKRGHKEQSRNYQAAYRQKNLERVRAYSRTFMQRKRAAMSPEQLKTFYRESDLRRNYGLTSTEYNERLAAQGGCCAI